MITVQADLRARRGNLQQPSQGRRDGLSVIPRADPAPARRDPTKTPIVNDTLPCRARALTWTPGRGSLGGSPSLADERRGLGTPPGPPQNSNQGTDNIRVESTTGAVV